MPARVVFLTGGHVPGRKPPDPTEEDREVIAKAVADGADPVDAAWTRAFRQAGLWHRVLACWVMQDAKRAQRFAHHQARIDGRGAYVRQASSALDDLLTYSEHSEPDPA